MSRVSGRLMEFWLSADGTAAANTDAIAYVRSSGVTVTKPLTNVTAAEDTAQEHVAGIYGWTCQVSGVLDKTNPTGVFQLESAITDATARGVAIVPVGGAGEEDDAISGTAICSSLQIQGQYDGTWTFNGQLTGVGAVSFDHATV